MISVGITSISTPPLYITFSCNLRKQYTLYLLLFIQLTEQQYQERLY